MRIRLLAAALSVAAGLSAQPAAAQAVTLEQYRSALHTFGADPKFARGIIVETFGDILPATHLDLLVEHAITLYNWDEFIDYQYQMLAPYLTAPLDVDELFAVAASVSQIAVARGVLRMDIAAQERHVEMNADVMRWLLYNDAAQCVSLAFEGVAPADAAFLEYAYYASLTADQLRAHQEFLRAAMAAEINAQPAITAFDNEQLGRGLVAFAAAGQTILRDSPHWRFIAAHAFSNVPAPALCQLGISITRAYRTLAEPERSWAIQGLLRTNLEQLPQL